jgi:hypothetical protein
VHPHPESRVIRPLHAGDIVALPHLNAVGRYVGDGAASKFEWYVSPSGPLCIGYPPDVASNADTDELDIMVDTGEIVILENNFGSLDAYDVFDLLLRVNADESHHGISGRAKRPVGFKTHTFQASPAGFQHRLGCLVARSKRPHP